MQSDDLSRTAAPARESLNAAFWDLGLRFQWDAATWDALAEKGSLEAQLAHYLAQCQPHLLGVYDPAFLAAVVKERLGTPANSRMGMEALSRA